MYMDNNSDVLLFILKNHLPTHIPHKKKSKPTTTYTHTDTTTIDPQTHGNAPQSHYIDLKCISLHVQEYDWA